MPSDSHHRRCREILGVQEGAPAADVKDAYLRQARRWHPDANLGNAAEAEKRMKEINEAYAVLTGRAGVAAGAWGRAEDERAERDRRAAEDERAGWTKGTKGANGARWTGGAKVPNRARSRTVAAIAAALAVWAAASLYGSRAAEQARAGAARTAALRQREDAAKRAGADRDRAAADERAKAERARKTQAARAAADERARAERARAARAAAEVRDAEAGRRAEAAENARTAEAAEAEMDAPPAVTLIAATQVRAKVDSQISTKASSAGGIITVTLDADITVDGRVVARRGAGGLGVVAAADRGFAEIRLTSLTLGGRAVPISTDRVRVLADRAIPQGTPVQFLLAAPVTVQPAAP
jgi:curved DNA-binding protein CbpA